MIVNLSGVPTVPTVQSRRLRKPACLPRNFENWGIVDKVLFVLAAVAIIGDLCFELVVKRLWGRDQGADRSVGGAEVEPSSAAVAAAAAETSVLDDPAVWLAFIAATSAIVVAAFVVKLWGGSRSRTRRFTFQSRDRDAAVGPCHLLGSRKWSMIDRLLFGLAVIAIFGDLAVEVLPTAENSDGGATGLTTTELTSNLRGAAIVTSEAPKDVQAESKEDPMTVVVSIESAAKDKYARPAECTSTQIEQIQKSGIQGDGCKGEAYMQTCSFTQKTRQHEAAWLRNFAEEIVAERANDEMSFIAVHVGDGCDKIEDELHFPRIDSAADALKSITKKSKLICTKISPSMSEEFKATWGVASTTATIGDESQFGAKTLDKYMADNKVDKTIKDVVIDTSAADSVKTIMGGLVTLARTRYVEFQYDWQGAWKQQELKPLIIQLDDLGHTCYWPGDGKLWRITGCWQIFYSFKSYSSIACVNRNLAPTLADSMEKMFLETIGSS